MNNITDNFEERIFETIELRYWGTIETNILNKSKSVRKMLSGNQNLHSSQESRYLNKDRVLAESDFNVRAKRIWRINKRLLQRRDG